MKPDGPTCTDGLDRPAMISLAIAMALLIGMAKPTSCWLCWPLKAPLVLAAVSMPMTWPFRLANGPPESPGMICASVCSIPVSSPG